MGATIRAALIAVDVDLDVDVIENVAFRNIINMFPHFTTQGKYMCLRDVGWAGWGGEESKAVDPIAEKLDKGIDVI